MDKPNRPVRNRRHSRKTWLPGEIHRPIKRLFTPEIKRMLKDWLVRRRENPYPSRDEKKTLAVETGLTYTQICNWFANWRRKLKNSGREPQRKTWGHLIKNYNTNAKGNVEQFSICSSDSIWGDDERHFIDSADSDNYEMVDTRKSTKHQHQFPIYTPNNNINNNNNNNNNNSELYNRQYYEFIQRNSKSETGFIENIKTEYISSQDIQKYMKNGSGAIIDHCYTPKKPPSSPLHYPLTGVQAQCFQISSTTDDLRCIDQAQIDAYKSGSATAKYKNHIMEKYLRGLDEATLEKDDINKPAGPQLSKWLESAANFTPNKNNYIDWNSTKSKSDKKKQKYEQNIIDTSLHQKEELDAAEALTKLAGNFRNRLLNLTQ